MSPILGIRGDIIYNPCLALRQFGYARRDGPHDMLIQRVIFDYESDDQGYRQRFIRAWRIISKVDSKTLGHKNSIPLEPYLRWVELVLRNLWCLILPSYQLSWNLWLKEMSRTLSSIMTCLLLLKTCCDMVAEPTVNTGLRFLFTKCRGKQDSPLTFILSNKEKEKEQKKPFFEILWVLGVDYEKGKY